MIATQVIAIFDVGKTNKKLLLFNEQYQLVLEESVKLQEIKDEDGFECEDIDALHNWMTNSFIKLAENKKFSIKAVNFSAYGASFVQLDDSLRICTPLYNYLKPYPEGLKKKFYDTYGGEQTFSLQTASPVLGSLNSGMQLYRLKYEHPTIFNKVRYSLHLPQYLSFILSSQAVSDITSIGCHTNLWDFRKNEYHEWVMKEGIDTKLAPLHNEEPLISNYKGYSIPVGTGLHDSSAALIPYLESFTEPFILLSTGTWCISLNPFNKEPLTDEELKADCLCYLTYKGDPVKASRLFAGYEHEQQIKRLSSFYLKDENFHSSIQYDADIISGFIKQEADSGDREGLQTIDTNTFSNRDLALYYSYEEAYHRLILDIVRQQKKSTELVLKGQNTKRIFVDGGFSKNELYMNLLASAFRQVEVFAASVAQSTAMGAALAIHRHWNSRSLPAHIIELKYYSAPQRVLL
jgi:sugar (pentulose or hexulose) kinase